MDSSRCIDVGEAFKRVRYDEEVLRAVLQRFAMFPLEDGFIEYAKRNLQEFKMSHIRLLHKNYLQSEEIKAHVWIESEKAGRDMKKEATHEWILKYHEEFNKFYYRTYWDKFVEADISDLENLICK